MFRMPFLVFALDLPALLDVADAMDERDVHFDKYLGNWWPSIDFAITHGLAAVQHALENELIATSSDGYGSSFREELASRRGYAGTDTFTSEE